MKKIIKTIFTIATLVLLTTSCKKNSTNKSNSTTVEYQFTATNPSVSLFVVYTNKDEISTTVPAATSGWKTTFIPYSLPFSANFLVRNLNVGGSQIAQTVTAKILVNGVVVQESTKVLDLANNIDNQIQFTVN